MTHRPATPRAAGRRSFEEQLAFVEAHTQPTRTPLVPSIELHLATEVTPLWSASEAWLRERDVAPPFWAFAWVGGQALARAVLDLPELVAQRSVLDFATGSGLVAIAAARAGAAHVVAVDIDPMACAAAQANAARNSVAIDVLEADVVGHPIEGVDVVLAGDIFYDRADAARFLPWLRSIAAEGITVLVGDPGRAYLPEGLELVASYDVPVVDDVEAATSKRTRVLRLRP
jgi:predicted nicotinamide N-methyase